jgi:hypothetical protein
MSNHVYANGMEVSCKAAGGKSIACFPDVCFTPPQTPATPPGVPIPYPNTGMASDATDGSTSVKISGQEVMLKNKSYFKQSTGDEAGSAPKKGVMTSKIKGKVYFIAWSMDVKAEGENVVRNLDMTTHNHGSSSNTAPWSYADRMSNAPAGSCTEEKKKVDEKCPKAKDDKNAKPHCPPTKRLDKAQANWARVRNKHGKVGPQYEKARDRTKAAVDDHGARMKKNECQQALRCFMPPYNDPPDPHPYRVKSKCCNGQTGHHVIPKTNVEGGCPGYSHNAAPVVCAEGQNQSHGTHKKLHDQTDKALMRLATAKPPKVVGGKVAYNDFRDEVVAVVQRVFGAGCTKDCLAAQLDNYYKKACGNNCKLDANNKQGKPIGNAGGTAKKKV